MLYNKNIFRGLSVLLTVVLVIYLVFYSSALAQDQIILQQTAAERKYSAFPHSNNQAFAQTFILPNEWRIN